MNNREVADAIREALTGPEPLPVPLKALVAATLMCDRGGAPTRLGMSKVGGYSYGSSQNHDLLDAIVNALPGVVAEMAEGEVDPVAAADLRKQLQQRDATVNDLRKDLAALTARHEDVRRDALALHERLNEVDAQAAAQTGARVRVLRPLG